MGTSICMRCRRHVFTCHCSASDVGVEGDAPPAAGATELPRTPPQYTYLVVADTQNAVLYSTRDWYDVVRHANNVRRTGIGVTVYRSTKG